MFSAVFEANPDPKSSQPRQFSAVAAGRVSSSLVIYNVFCRFEANPDPKSLQTRQLSAVTMDPRGPGCYWSEGFLEMVHSLLSRLQQNRWTEQCQKHILFFIGEAIGETIGCDCGLWYLFGV